MALARGSRSAPILATAALLAAAIRFRKADVHAAFACICAWEGARDGTRSYRLGTSHCTQFLLENAAFKILNFEIYWKTNESN